MKTYKVRTISRVRNTSKRKTITNVGSNFGYSLIPRELNEFSKVLKGSLVLPELNKATGAKVTISD